MRYFLWVCLFVGLLSAGCAALAAGVPAVSPADFGTVSAGAVTALNESPEAHWIWTILASEIIAAVAGWIFLTLSDRFKESRFYVALTAIKDAVTTCYHEYVRAIKAASTDGKLTIEEKNEALNIAYRTAVEYARTKGVDLLKVFAKETVLSYIEKYVRESKTKAVLAPLPDLAA